MLPDCYRGVTVVAILWQGKQKKLCSASCKVMAVIDASGGEVSVDGISQQVGMTSDRMRRIFKACHGIPPQRYIMQHRVNLALRLLRETNMTAAAVAFECGFSSQAHMNVAFKKIAGLTPIECRRLPDDCTPVISL